jgi:chorismate-pyruvate lyase
MKFNYKNKWAIERKLKDLPIALKRMLIDNSSLTKRIIKNNQGKVRLISTKIKLKNNSKKDSKIYQYERKVELKGNLSSPIKAVSYTPVWAIKGRINSIKILKDKSLATLLFRREKFSRDAIYYYITHNDVLRVTLFKRNNIVIRVEETFPKRNNYEQLSLVECRKNIIY